MPLIAVINKSTMVKDADVQTMCQAIQQQVNLHVLPAFNLKATTVSFYPDATKVPGYAWTINIIDDDTSVPGALGFHEETSDDKFTGYIMAKPILDNGGTVMVFDPKNPGQYTVSGTLSHEVIETIGDRFTTTYNDCGDVSWCHELCDPVEQIGYGVKVGDVEVAVSDFVFESFFNQYATKAINGPFNYLDSVQKPFQILQGGYAITRKGGPGTETQTFGPAMAEWRKACKQKAFSRGARRAGLDKQRGLWARLIIWLKSS
jgi:hypothetical protein